MAIQRRLVISLLLLYFVAAPLRACARAQGPYSGSPEIPGRPDQVNFDQTYARIMKGVEEGRLPEAAGVKAGELKISLEKYLIESEARIRMLEVDTVYGAEEARRKAFRDAVSLAAEREREKIEYLNRLQALLAQTTEGTAPVPASVTKNPSDGDQKKEKTKSSEVKWRTKELDIEIEVTPEDLTKTFHD